MKTSESVFVDTGAWIALALIRDPYHLRAKDVWEKLQHTKSKLFTSLPVIVETFTFLDRNTTRDVALAWKSSLYGMKTLHKLEFTHADLEKAWVYFQKKDLHKLSIVDAISFILMKREKIRIAFTFDHHFSSVGFRIVG